MPRWAHHRHHRLPLSTHNMQLLSRNESLAKKRDDETFVARQGMEIAERIDGLRKVALQEEKSMSVNRNQSLNVLMSALDGLNGELESVKKEIEKAKVERDEFLKPLTDEWVTLRAEQSSWLEKITEIENEKAKLSSLEIELQEKIDIADDNIETSNEIKEQSRKTRSEIELKKKEIDTLTGQFSSSVAKFNAERNTHIEAHAERERILANKEIQFENRIKNFNQREREFNLNVRKRR